MQYIHVQLNFPFSVEKLFNYLKKHENFNEIFAPAKVTTIQEGKEERYGIGSVRRLSILSLVVFEESIVEFKENALIAYKITKGTPLKNHYGKMLFASTAEGSSLDYTIQFESAIPGLAYAVKLSLAQTITKGLKSLQQKKIN